MLNFGCVTGDLPCFVDEWAVYTIDNVPKIQAPPIWGSTISFEYEWTGGHWSRWAQGWLFWVKTRLSNVRSEACVGLSLGPSLDLLRVYVADWRPEA